MKLAPSPVSGFTLTEMLVTLAIVGILAAIALPSFKSMMQSQRVKNASFEMYSLLSIARSEAIKRNTNVTVEPKKNGSVLERMEVFISGVPQISIKSMAAPKGVNITIVPDTKFNYKSSGRTVETGPITFQLDAENEATPTANVRCIKIELSGMPRSMKGTCS